MSPNVDTSLLIEALCLVLYVSLPFLAGILAGALMGGIIRVSTQIDDPVISFTARLFAFATTVYFIAGYYSENILGFAQKVWAGSAY